MNDQEDIIYSGSWVFPEQTNISYNGKLHYLPKKKGLILELEIEEKDISRIFSHLGKRIYPYVNGTLFTGTRVLLYNCRVGGSHTKDFRYTQQIVFAEYAFVGLHADSENDLVFKGALFDFGEIIEWSGLCQYSFDYHDGENSYNSYVWKSKEPVDFKLNDNTEVCFWAQNGGWSTEQIFGRESKISQAVIVEFKYENPVSWEQIRDDAQVIRYLIGMGINRLPIIAEIKYKHESLVYPNYGEGKTIYRAADVIEGTGEDPIARDHQNNERFEYLYSFNDLQGTGGIDKWVSSYKKLKPVLDLYFSIFGAPSVESVFLSMMQALETFHSRFITDNLSDYKSRVEAYNGYGMWYGLLLCEDQKDHKRSIILKSRLADLMFADSVMPFYPINYGHEDFIQKLVDTRNFFTHYDEKKESMIFTEKEFPYVNAELRLLLDYHLLVLLGFDKQVVRDTIVKKMNAIEMNYQIMMR